MATKLTLKKLLWPQIVSSFVTAVITFHLKACNKDKGFIVIVPVPDLWRSLQANVFVTYSMIFIIGITSIKMVYS